MSLLQFLRILAARRLTIIIAIVSCVVAALLVVNIVTPRYEAHSRLMLETEVPDPVTGETIGGPFLRAYTRTQVELVRDERVAEHVVEALDLHRSPELQQAFAEAGRDSGLDFRSWLTNMIIANTQARLIEGSNVLEITYASADPEVARRVADALRDGFVQASVAFRKEAARKAADWYAQQAEKARSELARAEAAKTQFEREKGIILEGDVDLDSARLAALAGTPANAPATGAAPLGVAPSAAQLAQVEAELAQASQSLGSNHPEMQELQSRRAALASQVAQERSAAGAAAGAGARAASAGAGAANRAYQSQRAKVIAQRDELEQLRRLQTDLDVRREQYTKTAARGAELAQQAELSGARLTLLGSATKPAEPVFPNKALILAGALGLGLALGVLLALLLELLNRRIRSVEDMEGFVGVPLLAVISTPPEARGPVALLSSSGRS